MQGTWARAFFTIVMACEVLTNVGWDNTLWVDCITPEFCDNQFYFNNVKFQFLLLHVLCAVCIGICIGCLCTAGHPIILTPTLKKLSRIKYIILNPHRNITSVIKFKKAVFFYITPLPTRSKCLEQLISLAGRYFFYCI